MYMNQPASPPSGPTHSAPTAAFGRDLPEPQRRDARPYTVAQFEALRATPDFAGYTYIWDGREPAADWKPIAAAPSAPARRAGPSVPPPEQSPKAAEPPVADVIPITRAADSRAARNTPVLRGYDVPTIEALCHDTRTVIAGKLTQVTDTGCELLLPPDGGGPQFGTQSRVIINLFDLQSGQAMNVAARLGGVTRRDGRWSLKVPGDGCPELIVNHLAQPLESRLKLLLPGA